MRQSRAIPQPYAAIPEEGGDRSQLELKSAIDSNGEVGSLIGELPSS
jgi:hypothetical protein